jgi:hypothetical protein
MAIARFAFCRRLLPLATAALGLAALGCKVDSGTSEYCERHTLLSGSAGGTDVGSEDYSVQVVWFNKSAEEQALSAVDKNMMASLGLDAASQEDVDRYFYWLSAYDLRLLFIEELSETEFGSLGAKLGKDLSIYFFDLAANEVQQGEAVQVFDMSPLVEARASGKSALGDAVRELVDEMRDNGKPDVIVGFAPDRSEEQQPEASLINLFSPNTVFATRGQGSFSELVDRNGDDVGTLAYPVQNLDATSLKVSGTFEDGTVGVEADCIGTSISG